MHLTDKTEHAFPAHELTEHSRLVHKWIKGGQGDLLDAGCAWGYATRFFARQWTGRTTGIDISKQRIELARDRYPEIEFRAASLEDIPFPDSSFDAVIACDVVEHVENDETAVTELFRVLRPGGMLFMTTPHRGAFEFLDPVNVPRRVGFILRSKCPQLYRWIASRSVQVNGVPWWESEPHHRHYSLGTLMGMFDRAGLQDRYRVERVFRSGLFLYPAALLTRTVIPQLPLPNGLKKMILRIVDRIAAWSYWVPAGRFSYNIGIQVRKHR